MRILNLTDYAINNNHATTRYGCIHVSAMPGQISNNFVYTAGLFDAYAKKGCKCIVDTPVELRNLTKEQLAIVCTSDVDAMQFLDPNHQYGVLPKTQAELDAEELAELREWRKNFDNTKADYESAITKLQSDNNNLQLTINNLSDKIASTPDNSEEINSLKTQVAELSSKNEQMRATFNAVCEQFKLQWNKKTKAWSSELLVVESNN